MAVGSGRTTYSTNSKAFESQGDADDQGDHVLFIGAFEGGAYVDPCLSASRLTLC